MATKKKQNPVVQSARSGGGAGQLVSQLTHYLTTPNTVPQGKPLQVDELPINNGVGSSIPMQTATPLPIQGGDYTANSATQLPIQGGDFTGSLSPKPKQQNPILHTLSNFGGAGMFLKQLGRSASGRSDPGSASSAPAAPIGLFLDPSVTDADIYAGRVPLDKVNHAQDKNGNYIDKQFAALAKSRPEIAQAITDRKNYEHQKMVESMTKGDQGPGIDPMAVQLLFQNAINPFMQGIVNSSNKQADNYASMMQGLLKDSSLPEAFRNVAKVQVPTQVNDMKNMTSAAAMNTASSPGIAALINLLNEDKNTQQYLINQNKLGQQAASGTLFPSS